MFEKLYPESSALATTRTRMPMRPRMLLWRSVPSHEIQNNPGGTVLKGLSSNILFAILYMGVCAPMASANPTIMNCTFADYSNSEGAHSTKEFNLSFTHDSLTGEAFLTGNLGASSVNAYQGDRAITFLEALPSGAIQSTTIDFSGNAVHSRHTVIGFELSPSQYYGRCESE